MTIAGSPAVPGGPGEAITRERVRCDLGLLPVPLERLRRIEPPAGPRIWVKRDDALGVAGGGNKLRKLEYLLGEAQARGADVVLTAGAIQSNHARLTAGACARIGVECELFLNRRVADRADDYELTGNVLLDRLFGARVTLLDGRQDAEAASRERAAALRAAGRRPYVIPVGGSDEVGTVGYVRAARELLDHGVAFDGLVVAASSGGTLAGLALGLGAAGWQGRLLGVAVSGTATATLRRVAGLVAATRKELRSESAVAAFTVDDAFAGPGYGVPTGAAAGAIRTAARLEGLLLDPVYTGKAFAGLLTHVGGAGLLRGCRDVVFVHTGGWPALFGYREELS